MPSNSSLTEIATPFRIKVASTGSDVFLIAENGQTLLITTSAIEMELNGLNHVITSAGIAVDGTQILSFTQQPAIGNPLATLADVQLKLQTLLGAMRAHGLIAT